MNQIIKKKRLQIDATPAQHKGEAQIALLKDGDVVRAIEVRCSCGDATVVELDYAEPQGPDSDT